MTARVNYDDFTRVLKGIGRISNGELQKALVANVHDDAPRVVQQIRAGAFTKTQRTAAASVRSTSDATGATIAGGGGGGGGGGLGATLFSGAEYGGRKSKKVPYGTRSPNGRAYVVKRRTTMQFLPHLGNEGYFFWVAIRRWLPELYKKQARTVEEFVAGGGRR